MIFTGFVLALLVVAQVFAAPEKPLATALATPKKVVPVSTVESPAGSIVFYGLANGANNTIAVSRSVGGLRGIGNRLQKRCGSNQVFCDGSNVPSANACWNLIYNIGLSSNAGVLPANAIAMCLTTDAQCCISWTARPANLIYADLYPAADETYRGCIQNGWSGITADTDLDGVCCSQCLSNRPTGCASCT